MPGFIFEEWEAGCCARVLHFKITSLLSFLLSVLFVQNYVPTVFENYTASFEIDTQRIELSLWDTSGKSHRSAGYLGLLSGRFAVRGGSLDHTPGTLSSQLSAPLCSRRPFSKGPWWAIILFLLDRAGYDREDSGWGAEGERRALCARWVTPR